MRWEDIRTRIWAKSAVRGQPRGELLDEHTLEVLRRLSQLHGRFPRLAEQAEDERLWHRLFWACFLHDLGKAAADWQAYVRPGGRAWGHRHEIASLAFLPWVADPASADFAWIAAAVASHHRDARVVEERYPADYQEGMGLETMFLGFSDETIAGLLDWFQQAPAQWIGVLGFESQAMAPALLPDLVDGLRFRDGAAADAVVQGLLAYRRLRRTLEQGGIRENRQALLYRGLLLLSDHLGSAHADPLGLLRVPRERLPAQPGLRDHQRESAHARGSLVLSAPTGSGKTEAALLWAAGQQAENPAHRMLYYVLPYQASINAMQRRLEETLATRVALLHGRSVQALYRRFLDAGYNSKHAASAARWARNLAGLQQPAVQVTTPYQLLRAAYRLRGFESVWSGLMGALVVVDEVHAYDPDRMGLFLGLLGRLVRDWDVKVCALTATMPSWLRALLVTELRASEVGASAADFRAFCRHTLRVADGSLESAAISNHIVSAVHAGGAVLVAANTVAAAQATWQRLRKTLGDERVRLLHSRFTARDRMESEQALLQDYGVDSPRRAAGVVVATQTIEVSLNLDFDTVISEPAPLEALAQRFGRVNRKARLATAPVVVLTQPNDGQGVYDGRLVERTLTVLAGHDGKPVDESRLSALLDDVYGADLAAEFTQRIILRRRRFEQFCLDSLHAFDSDEELEDQFDQLFDGVEVLPAAMEAAFDRLSETSPLEASGMLIPLQYRQLRRLQAARQARRRKDGVWVADATYDPRLGLQLV